MVRIVLYPVFQNNANQSRHDSIQRIADLMYYIFGLWKSYCPLLDLDRKIIFMLLFIISNKMYDIESKIFFRIKRVNTQNMYSKVIEPPDGWK